MSNYKNIFHYYRGQTKNATKETKQLQIENNVTKAFLNVLQHSSSQLTHNFINWIGYNSDVQGKVEYMYQVNSDIHYASSKAAIIGIADTKKITNGKVTKYNIPDGAILTNSVSFLIETKIGIGSYLVKEQLEGHKNRFVDNQEVRSTPIIVTWQEIRDFFKEQIILFEEQNDVLSCFLLKQFEEFCIINCIGEVKKTKEYFLLNFEKEKAQEMAKKVDNYIWSTYFNYIEDAESTDGIGYRKNGVKFVTLTTQRQRCLILHIGKKKDKLGLKVQEEIDSLLGLPYNRREYEYSKYPHEAYVRLEWIKDFNQIIPYIDLAYNSK